MSDTLDNHYIWSWLVNLTALWSEMPDLSLLKSPIPTYCFIFWRLHNWDMSYYMYHFTSIASLIIVYLDSPLPQIICLSILSDFIVFSIVILFLHLYNATMSVKRGIWHNSQNQWKDKNYYTVSTISNAIRNIVERDKIHIPNTQIHDLPGLIWALQ